MHGWDGPIGVFRFKYRSRGQFSCSFPVDIGADAQIPKMIYRRSSSSLAHPAPRPPGPPSAAELTTEQRVRLARMRYDDIEMLKSLTGASTNTAKQNSTSPQRSFKDLTTEEIDLLSSPEAC